MRIIGFLALTFVIMLLVGRILGRDALLFVSVACNLAMFGLRLRVWIDAKIAASRREQAGR